jgi:basic amino acid/polyamine antiporter, APA family
MVGMALPQMSAIVAPGGGWCLDVDQCTHVLAADATIFSHDGPHPAVTDSRTTIPRVPELRRVLTFWPLLLYGLAVIVGAGIYVAIGAVIARAGAAAPLSFLLAGVAAGLTGLCYAELAGRFPEASGGVAYVRHGFGSDRLAQLTGAAMTIAVAIAAASIARGAVHYLAVLLPLAAPLLTTILVVGFTGIACLGVRESVGLAAALSVIEIAGLLAATAAGVLAAPQYHMAGIWPADVAGWRGVLAGAFIAFFAFIGFETLANLAEEVKDPKRTVPRGILGAVAASVVLYVAVASAAVLADSTAGNPLLDLFEGAGASVFASIASIAVANGVLVEIVMLARLFYGMASKGQLPGMFGRVDPHTHAPTIATMAAGAIVLVTALLVPFEQLLVLTNAVTLGVFALIDMALWRVQQREPVVEGDFAIPHWVPPLAALLAIVLMLAEILV